ncbi:hypothetical protein VP01_384g6 [Puccinia sorghi]|uniref:Uncharacterized protein n=1 Tax=Puccinia sorghi TaxID=27349 RepID=A0A0L6UTZ0_9BASI|nr:hypothetical protein VP01_384g6 [Puccinia sorghi]
MGKLLAKFKSTVLSVKTSSSSHLTPIVILSIIHHFKVKFPQEHLIYTYFPRDPQTDWFKGYGFLHFQPRLNKSQDNQDYSDDTKELDHFAPIKHNPVQEIQVLKSSCWDNFSNQLGLPDFTNSTSPVYSPKLIKCNIEFSQSNCAVPT